MCYWAEVCYLISSVFETVLPQFLQRGGVGGAYPGWVKPIDDPASTCIRDFDDTEKCLSGLNRFGLRLRWGTPFEEQI